MGIRAASPLVHSLKALVKDGTMRLDKTAKLSPETWFLGPKAENAGLMQDLVDRALQHNFTSRMTYHPSDPRIFADGQSFPEADQLLNDRLDDMLHMLRGSIPIWSHRNVSHMYWDQSLPGVVGYIAALLYNQNNVAAEASPATTLMEIEVGRDLCRMLGFDVPASDDSEPDQIVPWGHITCDGSVANIESAWAARNARYEGVTLAQAVRHTPELSNALSIPVICANGQKVPLGDLTDWNLINLPLDTVLALPDQIATVAEVDPSVVDTARSQFTLQQVGIYEFHQRFLPGLAPPKLMVAQTAHYSWPKAMALVGLGQGSMQQIPVDQAGRMDCQALRKALDTCLAEGQPVMQVTVIMGSTEESAVDPLHDVLALRDEMAAQGLYFSVHVDGAWGGYFASLLRPAMEARQSDFQAADGAPGLMLSEYVEKQFQALGKADSITVDPHKAGFIPYPAGSLCYRNGAMRELISFKAPVVYHGGVDPTVGVYGVEGSKPGAAAAAVWLSHAVIRPDLSGYGDLLSRCLFNSKRFYIALSNLTAADITVTPFQQLPAERSGGTPVQIAAEKAALGALVGLDDDDVQAKLAADPALAALFRAAGPDLTISTYAFNFVTADGTNSDPALMNALNDRIYQALSIQSFNGGHVPLEPMFVTSSSFDPAVYGQDFVDAFAERAGVTAVPDVPIGFLISTIQNPWLTEAGGEDLLDTLMTTLGATASAAAQEIMKEHGLTPPQPLPAPEVHSRAKEAEGAITSEDDMSQSQMMAPRIDNMPHQHVFTIVGDETLFAVHMTQYYMEEHKYQLVLELDIDRDVAEVYRQARRLSPGDWFVLSNSPGDLFTIPDLASQRKRSYWATIFQGLPAYSEAAEGGKHFYPWRRNRAVPLIEGFQARVKRLVSFRPFLHDLELPDFAQYLIFGAGSEAHMTHLQTGRQYSSRFEALAFGPDYDHVMSLGARPDEFSDSQLAAGVVSTLPSMPLLDANGAPMMPRSWPYAPGDSMLMRYRGITPEFEVIAGHSYLFGTAVCSSPQTLTPETTCLDASATPEYQSR